MKKSISFILVLVISSSLILSACSKNKAKEDSVENQVTEESDDIVVDKNLLTVDIRFPQEIVGDTSGFNEEEYLAENQGIKSATVNDDGSITLTMTKNKHKELLVEMKEGLDKTFEELINGKDTPYIKDIESTKSYREVRVKVDGEVYEEAFDFTPFVIGVSAGMYQLYSGDEYKVRIIMEDMDTGEEIYSVLYPDEFENQ